jgi:hypothetical protein
MLTSLLYLLIAIIIVVLIFWVLGKLPLPAEIKNILYIAEVVICVIIIIYFLLSFTGTINEPLFHFKN